MRIRKHLSGLLALLCILATGLVHAQGGSLTGNVFHDSNGDSQQGDAEAGAGGVQVALYRIEPDGKRTLVTTVLTDAQGNYSFQNLPEGTYVLLFTFPVSNLQVESRPVTITAGEPNAIFPPVPIITKATRVLSLQQLGLKVPSAVLGLEVSPFAP